MAKQAVAKLEKELAGLRESGAAAAEIQAKLNEEIAQQKAEVKRLRNEIETGKANLEALQAQSETDSLMAKQAAAKADKELEAARTQIVALELSVKEAAAKQVELEKQGAQLRKEKADTDAARAAQTAALEDLKSKLSKAEVARAEKSRPRPISCANNSPTKKPSGRPMPKRPKPTFSSPSRRPRRPTRMWRLQRSRLPILRSVRRPPRLSWARN